MSELGRLEDPPPSLRGVLPPGKPTVNTRATHWPYAVTRPLLMKAGELTPIEKAERRVLVLANPGHGLKLASVSRPNQVRDKIAALNTVLSAKHPQARNEVSAGAPRDGLSEPR